MESRDSNIIDLHDAAYRDITDNYGGLYAPIRLEIRSAVTTDVHLAIDTYVYQPLFDEMTDTLWDALE